MLKSGEGRGPGSKQEDDKHVCSKFTRSHSLLLIVAVRAPATRFRNNLWAVRGPCRAVLVARVCRNRTRTPL